MDTDAYMVRLGKLERLYPKVVPPVYRALRERYRLSIPNAIERIETLLTQRGMPLPT